MYSVCHNYLLILLFQMIYYMHKHFLSFYKYQPDDGLVRPKLVKSNI